MTAYRLPGRNSHRGGAVMPPASPQKGVPDRSTVTWYVFDMIRAAGISWIHDSTIGHKNPAPGNDRHLGADPLTLTSENPDPGRQGLVVRVHDQHPADVRGHGVDAGVDIAELAPVRRRAPDHQRRLAMGPGSLGHGDSVVPRA